MTGKGDSWGRDSVGRSAPAFMAASTTALPPLTCTVRQEAGQPCLRPLFLLGGRPTAGCCFKACAGRSVCRLCLPAVPCSAGCVPATLCLPCPLPCSSVCPRSSCFAPFSLLCLPLFSPCAPGSSQVCCKLQELSCWQLQHGPAVAARAPVHLLTLLPFFLQSP